MSQRLLNNTKWLWCVLALHAGLNWGQIRSVTVRSPPGNPATVEAQAKFFQYRHFPTTEEFNQGHRLGSERHFTERHERARPSDGLFSAKVRWGDKKGGYGEHYWDLNHAGHAGNHGDDGYDNDGSYHEPNHNDHSDPYDEPSDNSPNYGSDDYDPDKSSYEESGRAKRAHPKIKVERKHHQQTETYEEQKPLKHKRKNREELQTAATHVDEEYADDDDDDDDEEEEEHYEKPKPKRQKHKKHDKKTPPNRQTEDRQHQTNQQQPKEKNQFVLVVSQKDDSEKQKQQIQPQNSARQTELPQYHAKKQPELPQYAPQKPEVPQYVPYEAGAGVRQYQQPEVSAATTVPRLFLEPSTGHVVDRATGQAYVLQPIAPKKYN